MKRVILFSLAVASCCASADLLEYDRPQGFKVGERLHVTPSVSFAIGYDSNVDQAYARRGDSYYSVNPAAQFTYDGDSWTLSGGAYYHYSHYKRFNGNLKSSGYGQNLAFNWSSDDNEDGRGWTLSLTENFSYVPQNDDFTDRDGKGIWRDRQQFNFAGALAHNFTKELHADIGATAHYLKYVNQEDTYAPLWGWGSWGASANIGYTFGKWTDLNVSANYSRFRSDNDDRGTADSWSFMGGIGTRASEKISYRIMGGMTRYEAGEGRRACGFTYSISGSWKMNDTWTMMLLASSYYHPGERDVDTTTRNDSISWGIAHTMIRGRLNATFDVAYQRSKNECFDELDTDNYAEDLLTARFGLSYTVNRYLSLFANISGQNNSTHGHGDGELYDFKRWRCMAGASITY